MLLIRDLSWDAMLMVERERERRLYGSALDAYTGRRKYELWCGKGQHVVSSILGVPQADGRLRCPVHNRLLRTRITGDNYRGALERLKMDGA